MKTSSDRDFLTPHLESMAPHRALLRSVECKFMNAVDYAKDVTLDAQNVAVNGVIDAKSYRLMTERSWLFRSVGWGHDALEWKRIVSALRLAGYDYVMSIEHEDALASVDEGLRAAVDTLSRVVLTEPPVEAWWT